LRECTGGAAVGCALEDNQQDQTDKDATFNTQVQLETSHSFAFIGCDFGNFQKTTTKTALLFNNCLAGYVQSCDFMQDAESPGSVGVRAYGECEADTRGIVIGTNRYNNLETAVNVDAAYCLDCTVMHQIINMGTGNIVPVRGADCLGTGDDSPGLDGAVHAANKMAPR
jgi:hypothetical protein